MPPTYPCTKTFTQKPYKIKVHSGCACRQGYMGACHRHTDICRQDIAVPLSWHLWAKFQFTNAKVGGREVATRDGDEGR